MVDGLTIEIAFFSDMESVREIEKINCILFQMSSSGTTSAVPVVPTMVTGARETFRAKDLEGQNGEAVATEYLSFTHNPALLTVYRRHNNNIINHTDLDTLPSSASLHRTDASTSSSWNNALSDVTERYCCEVSVAAAAVVPTASAIRRRQNNLKRDRVDTTMTTTTQVPTAGGADADTAPLTSAYCAQLLAFLSE